MHFTAFDFFLKFFSPLSSLPSPPSCLSLKIALLLLFLMPVCLSVYVFFSFPLFLLNHSMCGQVALVIRNIKSEAPSLTPAVNRSLIEHHSTHLYL